MIELAELWIVAGPNGAEKSTLVNQGPLVELLENAQFLNADDRTVEKLRKLGYGGFEDTPNSILEATFASAAKEVEAELPSQLQLGHKVCVETILSTESTSRSSRWFEPGGGFVGLIYVGIRSPDLLVARIAARVRRGGMTFRLTDSHRAGNDPSSYCRGLWPIPMCVGFTTTPRLLKACRRF